MNRSLTTQEERPAANELLGEERPIQTQVKEFFASDRGNYLAEWGVRITDRALIFHFYPPKGEDGEELGWSGGFDMPNRLKAAMDAVFDVARLSTGFVDEAASFYVIAGGYGRGFDPRPLAERFLDQIDAAFSDES